MSTGVASELETASPPRSRGAEKIAILLAKLFVTGACFWYVSRQVDLNEVLAVVPLLDFRWAVFAVVVVVLQVPLVALRWANILDALVARNRLMTRMALVAITAIGVFFTQVLPNVAGDGMRVWLLTRLGGGWRNAITSVVIDRAVGVGLLVAFGFGVLVLTASSSALGSHRDTILIVYAALLAASIVGLILVPHVVPILQRWRYTRELGTLAQAARDVLFGPRGAAILAIGCLVHALTIVVVWLLGRAQGLVLSASDAAVLFTLVVGVSLVPISVGGWGLRELAVVSFLSDHGVAPERALLFSVCFGLALIIGALPGALAWAVYPFGGASRAQWSADSQAP
jgi:uncharacterized membrane protein YbhN (UPF0104 family)